MRAVMRRRRQALVKFLIWILAGLVCLAVPATGCGALTPVPRRVLILYDSVAGQSERENIGFDICQSVLNHLGVLTDYQDVAAGPLPEAEAMRPYRGVITTFAADLDARAAPVLAWLEQQAEAKRRIVVFGSLGVTADAETPEEIRARMNRIYRRIGLDYHGSRTRRRPLIRYGFQDPRAVGFERPYPLLPGEYEWFVPLDPAVRVYLRLRRTDLPGSESAVVATGPGGAVALSSYMYWEDPLTFRKQWYLDPFLFFTEALDLEAVPAPDPTTLNGLRVAFSHVDGDAFAGQTRIDPKKLCADIIREGILDRYPFPVTVSVIVGEIDPKANGNPDFVAKAREIFALDNVEPASHAYSHPFYWDAGDEAEKSRYNQRYGVVIPGYRFDSKMEIDYSLDYITRHLSPPDKPARILLWSGNCLPTEADLSRCAARDFLNMNGGDTLFDPVNDSYTSVAPIYRRVGDHYQFHTGQANENLLTNLWTGPYHGFREIITTMERTGAPRRIAPVDIYYHFYSGEYPQSLRALQTVYEWALRQELALVFTSRYLEMARDYLTVALFRDDLGGLVVRNYGQCRTLRFPLSWPGPDLERSENVIGFVRDPQGLFVSLGPGERARIVRLTEDAHPSPPAVGRPHIRRAAGRIDAFENGPRRLRLRYDGFGRQPMVLGGFAPHQVVVATGTALPAAPQRLRADEDGRLRVAAVASGVLELAW